MYSFLLLYFKLKNVKVNILFWNVVEILGWLFVFLLEYEVIVLFVLFKVLYIVILVMFDVRVVVLYLIIICFFIEFGI